MPIEGKSLGEVVNRLRDHLNLLLARTVTRTPLVRFTTDPVDRSPSTMQIAFRQNALPVHAPLNTRFGPMGLFIGQVCESVVEDDVHRLRTLSYKYTLTPDGADEPLLRWEYVKQLPAPDSRWCRHHLQGPMEFTLGDGTQLLKKIKLPTGYIAIEDVIRFFIHDLGASPTEPNWDDTLERNYDTFRRFGLIPR